MSNHLNLNPWPIDPDRHVDVDPAPEQRPSFADRVGFAVGYFLTFVILYSVGVAVILGAGYGLVILAASIREDHLHVILASAGVIATFGTARIARNARKATR